MVQLALLLLLTPQRVTPMEIAQREIASAAGNRASSVHLSLYAGRVKECYSITGDGKTVDIKGSDPVGAMYGAFEFAERLKQKGEAAWSTKTEGEPFLPDRGLNLFLTLPWDYKKNNTDYDVAALTDPNRYWFANEDYWKTLLDTMAHSRLNWLDIHGTWDISVTNAPNLYAYFVTSPSFPLVGVPQETKDADLKRLNHVIDMAHERGIRVSLMAYEANLKIPQNPNPPYPATEANIYKYTKEVVEQMIRKTPGLDAIGFRIGESGHGGQFFTCYGEGIKASGRDIPLVTRSWVTRKQLVLPLARASKDFTVEIKYNGEQWGAPYPVAGGRMANWGSYSFEDYLSDSNLDFGVSNLELNPKPNVQIPNSKMIWPGWMIPDAGSWPSEPYKIVWQVRANGTHRIFPFYNPDWVRRSIKAMKVGTASGYTIEGEDAYYPKSPDYYLANPADKYCDWIHQRDEMYWMTWGRLGYDPNTPDPTFDARAQELVGGPDAKAWVQAWKLASLVVPKIYLAHALGPDHRDDAPELEWGGDTQSFIETGGFDTFTTQTIAEEYANRASGGLDGRTTAMQSAIAIQDLADRIQRMTAKLSRPVKGRLLELDSAFRMETSLAEYYLKRFEAADAAAAKQAHSEGQGLSAADEMGQAATAYRGLAENKYYRPFTERLRMHTNDFAWSSSYKDVLGELNKLGGKSQPVVDDVHLPGYSRGNGASFKVEANSLTINAGSTGATRAWLLLKPLPSSTFFHRIPMTKTGDKFEITVPRERWGQLFATEFSDGTRTWRDWAPRGDDAPYRMVMAQAGPTPQIYAFDEALTFFDPSDITPQLHGAMLIGTRANDFFNRYSKSQQRKVLEPVERGMTLTILQEDFNKGKLDFLPRPLRFESAPMNTFDPGGQLGLEKVDSDGIIYQRFLPSPGWEVFGNGGLARMKLGKGEIWVTSARLMQAMVVPSAARDFVKLLSIGGKAQPTVIIDACSEGSVFTSSCHQDLMNSHDIPFLTLGEVIAKEQGMNSFTEIPGPMMNDDVLNGKGQAMANKFLRDQVIALSKRPTAPSIGAFEKVRAQRKKELMKSLGLDPMPSKTPLNARITGVIHRSGYHIEKLVFESRPKFYVTGHVYVPDGVHGKVPVVVNVNGHWAHKKDEDRIQLRAAFQATQGYIAIAIDSPGWSFEGNNLIERRDEGPHNDWELVEGGTNTTGYYVWDAIRALDYMATRPDTDMKHIGLTGASGGGLATLYTFAADDRYSAAVPVVYMASMELAPDNGCLCNHVPGTSQIGDRSDVMAIQAPKPVYIMGAQNDGEFPPDATRLTGKKMKETWKLFGKDGDVYDKIYAGGHDYNQLMREDSIGFFNRYLKGQGDGGPVPQPELKIIDPEDRQLLALDPPATDERTMRDLSKEYLANAPQQVSAEAVIAINGGKPAKSELNYKETEGTDKTVVTFESEPGLVTPGILFIPKFSMKGLRIHLSDAGKAAEIALGIPNDGYAHLYIDALGTGELGDIEMRYPVYAGRAVAFTAGWQAVRAAEAMKRYSPHIEVIGRGSMSSQAAMYAGLLGSFDSVTGLDGLGSWGDVFKDGSNPIAVQPRAHLCGSLANLRKLVKNGHF